MIRIVVGCDSQVREIDKRVGKEHGLGFLGDFVDEGGFLCCRGFEIRWSVFWVDE